MQIASHFPPVSCILSFQRPNRRLRLIISVVWMIVRGGNFRIIFPDLHQKKNKVALLPILWDSDANVQRHRQTGPERSPNQTGGKKKKKNNH